MKAPDRAPPGAGVGLFAGVTIAALIVFAAVAGRHLVNADEGFYLAAGRDVASGLRPYADFFYPQMPYLPYAEAAVFSVSGVNLFAGRMLSAVPAAVLAGVLAVATARRTRRLDAGIAVAGIYGLHALSLNYLTVVKTYGLSNLFFTCGLLLTLSKDLSWRRAAAGGACAALAVGLRLPVLAVLLVLLLWSLRSGSRQAAAFAVGAAIVMLPLVVIAARDPGAFWFNNVGFHELRREMVGLGPVLAQKTGVLLKWVAVPQNTILWCLALVGWWRGSAREACALLCAAALGALYLYATPTYLEYMVQLMPLLLIAAAPAVVGLLDRRRFAVAVAAVYLVSLGVSLRPATAGSPRAMKNELWRLDTVETVADYLRQHSQPSDTVLSWWEGYPVLAGRPGLTEVGFWHSNIAKKLPEEQRERYRVAAESDVRELIEAGVARLIVVPEGQWKALRLAIDAGYERLEAFGRIEIFTRRRPATGAGPSRRGGFDG